MLFGKEIIFLKNVDYNLKNALIEIFKDIKNYNSELIILFSPGGASYDQYNNFVDRGNKFMKLVELYVKRNI